eukprot:TRINITY_DN34003_c0_g1_i1.p1 TRINITY_DN34003_c0_g1~~TRINITY_DN34003_c0_g1_i1.p1  ORF type:complete len:369 (+),score=18.14 TRINITY_DN34003_c0_g1_i1:26-1132(+)
MAYWAPSSPTRSWGSTSHTGVVSAYELSTELDRAAEITRRRNVERRQIDEDKRAQEAKEQYRREHELLAQQKREYELGAVANELDRLAHIQEQRRATDVVLARKQATEEALASAERNRMREQEIERLAQNVERRRVLAADIQRGLTNNTIPRDRYSHLDRLLEKSEARTPLLISAVYEDPLPYIQCLADECRQTITRCTINHLHDSHVIPLFEETLQNGDWLYIDIPVTHYVNHDVFRKIATTLTTLSPSTSYPYQEYFRLWVCTSSPVDINETTDPVFPTIFTTNCLCATPSHSAANTRSPLAQKVIRKKPVDPVMVQLQMKRAELRHRAGRDSDSESDVDETDPASPRKVFGPMFMPSPRPASPDV